MSQGFKNSPTLFDEALSVGFPAFQQRSRESTLLCVSNLLKEPETEEECMKATEALIETIQDLASCISAKKAQDITFFGRKLKGGKFPRA